MMHAQTNEIRDWLRTLASFVFMLILTLLPMPHLILPIRPAWVLMILIFWSLILSGRVCITLAFILGLLLDVLNGTLLGEHAFALTAVVYGVAKLSNQMRMFTLFQQGIGVFVLVLIYQFILFCIQGFLGDLQDSWLYWLPALTSMLLWPWFFIIMKDWSKRFEN